MAAPNRTPERFSLPGSHRADHLLKKRPWGFTLACVVLLKILNMGTALIAMILNQVREGVAVDPVVSVVFVIISISGMILAVAALRNIRDEAKR